MQRCRVSNVKGLGFKIKCLSASRGTLSISITSKALLGFFTLAFISLASAHSFNLVFIAPLEDPTGQSALNGFQLATREQDRHENEELDGHLGGLDSYIFRVGSLEGEVALMNQLEKTIRKSKPLFAVGLDLNAASLNMLENNDVVVVDPMSSGLSESLAVDPGQLKLIDGEDFTSAYRRAYGHDPDLQARHGYLAARIVATVVRKSDEQSRKYPSELKQILNDVLAQPHF
jgi:hypothetical protein